MNLNLNKENMSHIGDILAIPFFLLLIIYFYQKKTPTQLEQLFLLFAIAGFALDSYFTYIYFYTKK